jgi:hypothetical protein
VGAVGGATGAVGGAAGGAAGSPVWWVTGLVLRRCSGSAIRMVVGHRFVGSQVWCFAGAVDQRFAW